MNTEIYIDAIENELEKCCDEFFYGDSRVGQAARYSLLKAGKRIRAVLMFLTAEMCGGNWQDKLRLACGVEMIHCYSLIHDDLPCMDNDDLRRGKPSCHKAFGEATALLAGDALLGCGLQAVANDTKLSDQGKIEAMKAFTDAMGPKGMIYGQELDLEHEDKKADKEMLNRIHRHKTGRMISLSGYMGSLDCGINDEQKKALKLFFENIGLVFQIVDDILDVEGNVEELGKPIGSDRDNNKSTFVSLYGLENSKKIAEEMTKEANDALIDAFGEGAVSLVDYTAYLLNRKK